MDMKIFLYIYASVSFIIIVFFTTFKSQIVL